MRSKKTIKYFIYSSLMVIFLFSSFNGFSKRELTYVELVPTIKSGSSLNVCVATLDQREVVLLGKQNAKFVGYIRSSVMIAYPIRNSSDMNFSEAMSTTVANALKNNACTTSVMKTDYSKSKTDILNELKTQEADIFILITMTKWRTDTKAMNAMKLATELSYDLTAEVYNKAGELIATNTLDKVEPGLSPSGSASSKKIQAKVINTKYPEVMTNLFANPEIENALK
ncbi:MAG: hypothetical protein GQ564_16220 [Bacteroidales bacterium]|nr:hypothetical protein [Bacteroidales bacterium]